MPSKAATVKEYLDELPADRRAALNAVRRVFREHMDPVFVECMQYGMIGYAVPHAVFAKGYHCDPRQPLPFAGLASQKNHMSLYLMCLYTGASDEFDRWFSAAWERTGKKLDKGKACIRFKTLDDLALDVLGEAIRRVSAKEYIARYEASLAAPRPARARAAKPRAKPAAGGGARAGSAAPKKRPGAAGRRTRGS